MTTPVKDDRPLRTYEVTWSNGYTEHIEAQSVEYPPTSTNKEYPPQPGYGHVKFWVDLRVIASAREGNLISVREIPVTVLQETPEETEDKTDGEGQEKED